ncbi:MAG: hypothetical protein R3251_03220 [Candidatus Spechtbacterales bacterium]|nr:hypothetical protein [Candidatus Spechtbacterales bacterium]
MANEYLVKYVRQMRQNGASDEKIKQALVDKGYSESEILGALWHDINQEQEQIEEPKSHLWIYNVLLILLLAGLAAVALYLRVWDPAWNPFPPPAEFLFELNPF